MSETNETLSPLETSDKIPIPHSQGIPFERLIVKLGSKSFEDLIKCKICFNILNNPYDCTNCGHSFCYECINSLIAQKKNCPFNCSSFSIKHSSFGITSYLSSLSFSCVNKANGCNDIISYGNLKSHEKQCKFFYTSCPNAKCGKNLKWTLLEGHLKNECEYTLFACPECRQKFYRKEINEHIKNCNNILQSLEYFPNQKTKEEEKQAIETFNDLMSKMPEIKEVSLLSFLKTLMFQINSNNIKLNEKMDLLKEEMKGIKEDVDRVCKDNIIFFESINTELETITNKISRVNGNDMRTDTIPSIANDDITSKKIFSSSSNNNSILIDNASLNVNNHQKKVSFTSSIEILDEGQMNKTMPKTKTKYSEHKKKNYNTNKEQSNRNVWQKKINQGNNENISQSRGNNNYIHYPPSAKPFNTFSSYTNSNLVIIINNQENIIKKLQEIEKKVDESQVNTINKIKESEMYLLNMISQGLFEDKKVESERKEIIDEKFLQVSDNEITSIKEEDIEEIKECPNEEDGENMDIKRENFEKGE